MFYWFLIKIKPFGQAKLKAKTVSGPYYEVSMMIAFRYSWRLHQAGHSTQQCPPDSARKLSHLPPAAALAIVSLGSRSQSLWVEFRCVLSSLSCSVLRQLHPSVSLSPSLLPVTLEGQKHAPTEGLYPGWTPVFIVVLAHWFLTHLSSLELSLLTRRMCTLAHPCQGPWLFCLGLRGGVGEGSLTPSLVSFPPPCKVSLCNLGGFPGTLDRAGFELTEISLPMSSSRWG